MGRSQSKGDLKMNWNILSRRNRQEFGNYLVMSIVIIIFSALIVMISTSPQVSPEWKTGLHTTATMLFSWGLLRLFRAAFGVSNSTPSSTDLLRQAQIHRAAEQAIRAKQEEVWKDEFVPFMKWHWGAKMLFIIGLAILILMPISFIAGIRDGSMILDWNKLILLPVYIIGFIYVYFVYKINSVTTVRVEDDWQEIFDDIGDIG